MFVLSSICGETLSSIQESIGDFPDVGTVRERMTKLQERVSDMDSIVETTKGNVNKVRRKHLLIVQSVHVRWTRHFFMLKQINIIGNCFVYLQTN